VLQEGKGGKIKLKERKKEGEGKKDGKKKKSSLH